MKTLIIIPAFNEVDNIPTLVENIEFLGYDYLVINDCSTDNSKEVYKKNGINCINLPINLGLASVTQVGFMYAREHGFECVVVVDGDGQHPPKYISHLVDKLKEGYDYVVGSRFVNEKKPITMRMIGSRIICLAIFLKTGKKFTDPTSGMRAMGIKVFNDFSKDFNFIAEPDALVHVVRKKAKVVEMQVDMEERVEGESYFANPIKSMQFMLNIIVSILFMK